jgi:thiamine pyrophosphate-dependent acetolactate synthase large subunit-like protein
MTTQTDHDSARTGPRTATVREVTYDLLRANGLTTIFGNVGSTEETFLADFPSDFRYVLGLQEASVMAMADGFAQAMRRPALVNLHTGAGLGNAMGTLLTAFENKTPLIVTSGQQTRQMLLMEPWLTNVDATMMPRPWVKWAYQPVRAQDVPAAFMRAIAVATQPPAGPVFLSLPLDDWDQPCEGPAVDPGRAAQRHRLAEIGNKRRGRGGAEAVAGRIGHRKRSVHDAVRPRVEVGRIGAVTGIGERRAGAAVGQGQRAAIIGVEIAAHHERCRGGS